MDREDVLPLALKVIDVLKPFCNRVSVAGSLRRLKPEVNDIDIVAIPKAYQLPGPLGCIAKYTDSKVWMELIPSALAKAGLVLEMRGQELVRCSMPSLAYGPVQVDLYRARSNTWGLILLVRTGSKDHNVKLCTIGRMKGLKLSASEGVVTQEGFGQVIASSTEEEIFTALGLAFVEPKHREVS